MKISTPFFALVMLAQSGDSQWVGRLAFWMRSDLRNTSQRIATIDETLGALPELTQVNSSASIGFKTAYMPDEEELWVDITLPNT